MKGSCVLVLIACALAVPAAVFAGSSRLAATPIAHYPLVSDSLDALGLNDPMIMTNTEYQDGGVYCNGIYASYPGGFELRTPQIAALNFGSFAASIEFKISQYTDFTEPVLVGGMSYRWIGASVYPDGKLALLYNNGNYLVSETVVTLDTWHQVVLSYDSATPVGALYLDNAFVCSVNYALVQDGDKDFGPMNPSTGKGFLGIVRHLVVYDGAFDPTAATPASWGLLKLLER